MRITRVIAPALLASGALVNASAASAADTVVGQTAAPTTACTAGTLYQAGTAGPPSYVTPSGVITRWSVQTNANVAPIKLKVLHALGGGSYRVIGESAAVTPNANSTQTFNTRIPTGPGNYLAISVLSGSADCRFTTSNYADAVRESSTIDPAVGSTITTPTGHPNTRLDVSAVVEPDQDGDGYGDTTQDQCDTDPATQAPCQADVSTHAVSIFKSPQVGKNITWSITVQNKSPNATAGWIIWRLPRWVVIDSVVTDQNGAPCHLGLPKSGFAGRNNAYCLVNLAGHDAVTMIVHSRPFAPGMIHASGGFAPYNSSPPDKNPLDDFASARRFIAGIAPACALDSLGQMNGTPAGDIIHGTGGADTIYGDGGPDCLYGNRGDDRIHGGRADDRIRGGRGNDEIWGGLGNDSIRGGSGADVIHARDGHRDVVRCGSGFDTVYVDRLDLVARNCEVVLRAGP